MSARAVLTRLIAGIPDLLGRTATPNFIGDPAAHVHVRSTDEVADRIASVLPALLAAEGYMLVQLPNIDPDGYGGWSVRVPLSEQPCADGEVFIDQTGRLALSGFPSRIPLRDALGLAAALLAIHTTAQRRRR